MRWYLIVVWIRTCLLISAGEHLFMYLLAICIFFWKMSLQVLCPFLKPNCLFTFSLLLNDTSSFYILNTNLLINMWFVNIFFSFHRLLFHLADFFFFFCSAEDFEFDIVPLDLIISLVLVKLEDYGVLPASLFLKVRFCR